MKDASSNASFVGILNTFVGILNRIRRIRRRRKGGWICCSIRPSKDEYYKMRPSYWLKIAHKMNRLTPNPQHVEKLRLTEVRDGSFYFVLIDVKP